MCARSRQFWLPPRHETKNNTAIIELYSPMIPIHSWTVVQWQDGSGGWNTVDGWQGTLNDEHRIRWWLGEEHFGTGPFRWIIQESQGGEIIFVSESFDMASQPNEVVVIEILSPALR